MASLCACIGDTDPEGKARSKQIDKSLRNEKTKIEDEMKLLLLGAGDAGKSTIFKQMKILHQDGFSDDERQKFRGVVWSNVIVSLQAMIEAAESFKIQLGNARLTAQIQDMSLGEQITPDLGRQMKELWLSEPMQAVFARGAEYQLQDSTRHFLNDLERLSTPGYVPSEEDVLRTRVRTTGIVETSWVFRNVTFRMFDVGGQRNERRKWIHCFDNVKAVIFVAALSEYDQVLFEDSSMNRMTEALNLFEQICNSRWFQDTDMILFLNKKDLFEQKLAKVPLSDYFPDFEGPNDMDTAAEFIAQKFVARRRPLSSTRQIYMHLTCATDTSNIRVVFAAVRDIIFQGNMRNAGF